MGLSSIVTGLFLAYLVKTKEVSFKKIFFGSLITADLYFMTHISDGSKDNPWVVLSFVLTSLFLAGSFLYNSLSIKSDFPQPHLNIFTKVGLGIFKVIVGTRSRFFWLMSTIYFAGVMIIIQPGHKPPWAWWVGGGTTLMYIIFNLVTMRRNGKEIEASFSRPSQRQEMPLQPLRQDPHPGGADRVALIQPVQSAERNRTIGIYVEGVRVGMAQLSPRNPDPIMEVLPEPEPENRLARVLRDNYPL